MAKSVSTNQRGFTLIEMSIVLVIIGLIIGGILKGQELIESSRQKNLMSQLDRLKSGTTTFTDRYKGLPGDYSRIALLPAGAALTSGGNDNGVIGAATSSTAAALATLSTSGLITEENTQYFNQLLAADLGGPGSVVGNVTIACFSGLCATPSPLPSSAFPSSGLTLNYGSHEGGTNATGTAVPKQAHWFVLSRYRAAALTATDAVLSASRSFQIDNKYDDGGAGTGNIRSAFIGTNCGTAATDYVATGTTTECVLMFTLE